MKLRNAFCFSFYLAVSGALSCIDGAEQTPEFDRGIDFNFSNPDLGKDATNPGEDTNILPDTGINGDMNDANVASCECPNGQVCVLDLCIPDLSDDGMQLENLRDAPQSERFPLSTERVWPDDTQSPHIALWYDDKYAAVSITVDDNPGPDFDWWLSTADQFKFKMTWCVISDLVENGNAFFGTWPEYQGLVDRGHALCSHGNIDDEPPAVDAANAMTWFDDAYRLSRPLIESKVPNIKADTLAHPWGKFIRPLAAQYYIAGRGVRGGINKANEIDYMDLRSTSRGIDQNSIDTIMGKSADGRGWFMAHFHYMQGNLRQETTSELEYLAQFSDEIWFSTLPRIAKYGQERDTARLTLHSSNNKHQIFSLSDDMKDSAFDFPLTIKSRLPDSWTDIEVQQGNQTMSHRIASHQGANFVLFDAVPNRGPISVSPQ